jgi:hypothetical protein
MPVIMHDDTSLPDEYDHLIYLFNDLCKLAPTERGFAFLTVDQKFVRANEYHRRPGLHVDGMGVWGGGTWAGRGLLVASDVAACVVWNQKFSGSPVVGSDPGDPNEGNCEHLRNQLHYPDAEVMLANMVYWCGPMCVHESWPVQNDCYRTFVRLSLPNAGMWPSNCTPNHKVPMPHDRITTPRRIGGQFAYGGQDGETQAGKH